MNGIKSIKKKKKLTCGTVGNASLSIRSQNELIRANAFETDRSVFDWRQETQAGTASVVLSARIGVSGLSERMVNVEIVGPVRRVAQHRVILSRPLIGPADGLQVPIGPEDEIIKDGDGENVWDFQGVLDYVAPIPAVQV